jgi:hypothetical protein
VGDYGSEAGRRYCLCGHHNRAATLGICGDGSMGARQVCRWSRSSWRSGWPDRIDLVARCTSDGLVAVTGLPAVAAGGRHAHRRRPAAGYVLVYYAAREVREIFTDDR